MAEIEFIDLRLQVMAAVESAAVAFLYEAAGELEAQVKRNTRVDTGQLKNSWTYAVDEAKLVAEVGSPQENAIWEEFGTGEYALSGGRKNGWWVKVGHGKGEMSPKTASAYGWEKVRKDSQGNITFVFTRGKKPNRAFSKAYDKTKPRLIARAKQIIGDELE